MIDLFELEVDYIYRSGRKEKVGRGRKKRGGGRGEEGEERRERGKGRRRGVVPSNSTLY